MAQHDIEITISKDGKVRVHVKGAKGKACREYTHWLAEIVGKVESEQLTSEYYEPETKAAIALRQELRNGE